MIERILTCEQVTTTTGSCDEGNILAQYADMSNEGHALSMRTVEYGERILAMSKAATSRNEQASLLLQPPEFTRSDKYPPQVSKGRKRHKLFQQHSKRPLPTYGSNDGERSMVVDPPLRTLAQRLEAFKGTVMRNPHILRALQRRRFSMVSVLEAGVPAPPQKTGRKAGRSLANRSLDSREIVENPLCSAVAIGWSDLAKRFVAYCTEHIHQTHGTTVQLIFETWMAHLMKARTLALEEDGVTPAESIAKASILRQVTPHALGDGLYADYRAKQVVLNTLGVTKLLANVVSSVDDISPGGYPDLAIELFIELLNGGCLEGST